MAILFNEWYCKILYFWAIQHDIKTKWFLTLHFPQTIFWKRNKDIKSPQNIALDFFLWDNSELLTYYVQFGCYNKVSYLQMWSVEMKKLVISTMTRSDLFQIISCSTCAFCMPSDASTATFRSTQMSLPDCRHLLKYLDASSTSPRAR